MAMAMGHGHGHGRGHGHGHGHGHDHAHRKSVEFLTENGFDLFKEHLLIFDQIWHLHENKKDAGRPYDSFAGGIAPRSLF